MIKNVFAKTMDSKVSQLVDFVDYLNNEISECIDETPANILMDGYFESIRNSLVTMMNLTRDAENMAKEAVKFDNKARLNGLYGLTATTNKPWKPNL